MTCVILKIFTTLWSSCPRLTIPFCWWWNWDIGNVSQFFLGCTVRKWWIQNLNLDYPQKFLLFLSNCSQAARGFNESDQEIENEILIGGLSYPPLYSFRLFLPRFSCHYPYWTEGLPHTLACKPLAPSTIVAFKFDLLVSTCLNDKIEKAFTV